MHTDGPKRPSKTPPLLPQDALGRPLAVGDSVTIVAIAPWLTHDLPAEESQRLLALQGSTRVILAFDEFGYVWFGDGDDLAWFCLHPTDVARVTC